MDLVMLNVISGIKVGIIVECSCSSLLDLCVQLVMRKSQLDWKNICIPVHAQETKVFAHKMHTNPPLLRFFTDGALGAKKKMYHKSRRACEEMKSFHLRSESIGFYATQTLLIKQKSGCCIYCICFAATQIFLSWKKFIWLLSCTSVLFYGPSSRVARKQIKCNAVWR